MNPLLALPSAFGLSGASGLNASLPLFLTSLFARLGYIHLHAPFTALQTDLCFYGLLALVIVEFAADKIPAFDSVFHMVMLPISAASGAILFAASAGAIAHMDSSLVIILSLLVGAVTAGSVHATRAIARPPMNIVLLGPVSSFIEDVTAVLLTIAAFFAPILIPVIVLCLALLIYVAVGKLKTYKTKLLAKINPV